MNINSPFFLFSTAGVTPHLLNTSFKVVTTLSQISSGSCSTQPSLGYFCENSCWAIPSIFPFGEKKKRNKVVSAATGLTPPPEVQRFTKKAIWIIFILITSISIVSKAQAADDGSRVLNFVLYDFYQSRVTLIVNGKVILDRKLNIENDLTDRLYSIMFCGCMIRQC